MSAMRNIMVPKKKIVEFCKKWHILEFSFFGSVLGDSFSATSDIDVLVRFDRSAQHGLFELAAMREELETLFGRSVDLVEMDAVKNPYRRASILANYEVLYAA
ncbi:MAG TPA: nucleotidyltransferase domain-containing protein [bacterium]|nr:nucleotidyltransferase domain-containing protein [bacterium]